MVILNVYGVIESTIISKKLGIGISNPFNDWINGFQDDMLEEILIQDHDMKVLGKMGIAELDLNKYDPSDLVKKAKWSISSEEQSTDLEIIARNLIGIDVLRF
ncbi:hypothetical protein HMSSN036_48790 [Paenibacillus macerans]|nr:hypothetical protein HMSSN036_48790 [Paenibacillus macerans]